MKNSSHLNTLPVSNTECIIGYEKAVGAIGVAFDLYGQTSATIRSLYRSV